MQMHHHASLPEAMPLFCFNTATKAELLTLPRVQLQPTAAKGM